MVTAGSTNLLWREISYVLVCTTVEVLCRVGWSYKVCYMVQTDDLNIFLKPKYFILQNLMVFRIFRK